MRAMVLAAGLGTRLRPLTREIAKPMVPVLDRPVMAHIVDLLAGHQIVEVIANLHHFPEPIRDYFGDRLEYRFEETLLGTAGGVRNCADFFAGETFLVISGDALTDIDLGALLERHKASGAIATIAAKRVEDTREYGVVLCDADGRITGFQEKPTAAQARSNLGNCGIYCFEPEIFDYFPDAEAVDWAGDVFPALLAADAPFYVCEIAEYWNDVGSLAELRAGTFDAVAGALAITVPGTEISPGVIVGEGSDVSGAVELTGPVWIGSGVTLGAGSRIVGPAAIGDGVRIGAGAALRETIVFPGGAIEDGVISIGAITGNVRIAAGFRRPTGVR